MFVKPAGGWASATETAKLTASDGAVNDNLGSSVALSGDTIVAGAPTRGPGVGAAYVFVKPAGGWASTTETAEVDRLGRRLRRHARAIGCGLGRHHCGGGARDCGSELAPGGGVRVRQAGGRLGERHRDGQADRLGRRRQRPARVLGGGLRRHDRRRRVVRDCGSEPVPGGCVRVRQSRRAAGRAAPRRPS